MTSSAIQAAWHPEGVVALGASRPKTSPLRRTLLLLSVCSALARSPRTVKAAPEPSTTFVTARSVPVGSVTCLTQALRLRQTTVLRSLDGREAPEAGTVRIGEVSVDRATHPTRLALGVAAARPKRAAAARRHRKGAGHPGRVALFDEPTRALDRSWPARCCRSSITGRRRVDDGRADP